MKQICFILCLLFSLCSLHTYVFAKERTVIVYNWSEYIPAQVLKQFQKETGIRVIYSTYESNEAMYAKLKIVKGVGYDVIIPSTYFVSLLKKDNLLQKIDKSKLSNFKYLNPALLNLPFDTNNEYTIPYMWGSDVLLMNSKVVDTSKISSWNDLLLPEFKRHVFLSDDLRDTFGIALMALGLSPNTRNLQEIEQAGMWLQKLMPSVYIFDVTAQKQVFITEEVRIGTAWNGDAFIAIQENPSLVAIYPKEGVPMWVDSFAIPIGANNVEEAYEFINFMLRPEIAVQCVQEYSYSTPNQKALEFLPKELAENPLINPPLDVIKKMKTLDDVGSAIKDYERIWEKLKVEK